MNGGKTVLITGSNGFLGGAVGCFLRSRGFTVIGLGRLSSPVKGTVDRYVCVDLQDKNAVSSALSVLPPITCVFHFAGMTSTRHALGNSALYHSVNVGGFANLLLAMKLRNYGGLRVILASTGAVYGGSVTECVDEDAITTPIGPYAETKLVAERILHEELMDGGLGSGTSLRIFGISGSYRGFVDRDPGRMIPKLMRVAVGVDPYFHVNGDGSAVREFLDIRDFSEVCERCTVVDELRYPVVNIGGGPAISVREAVSAIKQISHRDFAVEFGGEVSEQRVVTASTARANDMLSWNAARCDPLQVIGDAWEAFIGACPAP